MPTIALINPKSDSMHWGIGNHPRAMDHALIRHSLTHLSSVLKRAGHHAILVDLRKLSGWPEYEENLKKTKADFVCVTAHTAEADTAMEALLRAKRALPHCITVAGGIHWTMFPDQAAQDGAADFVLRGEGDQTLPQLIDNPSAFPEILWGDPPDLDHLPFEDRELVPKCEDSLYFPFWNLTPPVVEILTGRGCPWNCRFCCGPGEQNLFTRDAPQRPGRRVAHLRRRSTDHVMEELRQLSNKYCFKGIVFHDDQFLIDPEWVMDFCRKMHREGYAGKGVRWWAACRADMICRFPHIVREMKQAGLSIISIGFESFSDPLLAWMDKGIDAAANFRAAEICRENGLDIYANVMFGIPREDGRWHIEDDLATLHSLKTVQPRFVSPSYLNPIPGSWFHKWYNENGLLLHRTVSHTGNRSPQHRPLRGVDYNQLDLLLSEIQKTYREPWRDRLRYYRYRLKTRSGAFKRMSPGR